MNGVGQWALLHRYEVPTDHELGTATHTAFANGDHIGIARSTLLLRASTSIEMKRLQRITDELRAKLARDPAERVRSPSSEPTEASDGNRDGFRFSPELFEVRTDVMSELSNRGFDWLTHYSSVDPIHDCYGIEVCGIREKDDAESILRMLMELFPDWRPG